MTFLMCDPGWYVQLDVQNEWEENTHTQAGTVVVNLIYYQEELLGEYRAEDAQAECLANQMLADFSGWKVE